MEILQGITIEFWKVIMEMAPYLLFGFFIAGILSVFFSEKIIKKYLSKKGIGSVVKAAFLGVPLPLCSCGVIPVGISLNKNGASRGASISFLISTPQTGVDSIAVTYSLLGLVYAIYRPIVAFVSGILGGIFVDKFADEEVEVKNEEKSCCKSSCCSADKKEIPKSKIYEIFHYGFVILPKELGRALILGILISAAISYLVPPNFFAKYLTNDFLSMAIMLVFGIPLYVCSTASVPVAASLIAVGVTPGAALVFLITGPATNGATITTIYKVMGKKVVLIYLATISISAFIAGYILNLLYHNYNISVVAHSHEMFNHSFGFISGIILIIILLPSLFQNLFVKKEKLVEKDNKILILEVHGMSCSDCSSKVEKKILGICEVEEVKIDLETKKVKIIGGEIEKKEIISVITNLGYKVIES